MLRGESGELGRGRLRVPVPPPAHQRAGDPPAQVRGRRAARRRSRCRTCGRARTGWRRLRRSSVGEFDVQMLLALNDARRAPPRRRQDGVEGASSCGGATSPRMPRRRACGPTWPGSGCAGTRRRTARRPRPRCGEAFEKGLGARARRRRQDGPAAAGRSRSGAGAGRRRSCSRPTSGSRPRPWRPGRRRYATSCCVALSPGALVGSTPAWGGASRGSGQAARGGRLPLALMRRARRR